MRRWNGWGDSNVDTPCIPGPCASLSGASAPASHRGATFADAVTAVPPSRLPAHPLVTDPADRLRRARGQSFPDWVALRSGRSGSSATAGRRPVRIVASCCVTGRPAGALSHPLRWRHQRRWSHQPGRRPAKRLGHRPGRLGIRSTSTVTATWPPSAPGSTGRSWRPNCRRAASPWGISRNRRSSIPLWAAGSSRSSCGQQSLGYGRIERLFAGKACWRRQPAR